MFHGAQAATTRPDRLTGLEKKRERLQPEPLQDRAGRHAELAHHRADFPYLVSECFGKARVAKRRSDVAKVFAHVAMVPRSRTHYVAIGSRV